jgi:hypothetical protein
MITIDFTYQTTTPESAANGDFDSHGFITEGLWKFDADNYERVQWKLGDLAGLISFAQSLGITHDGDAFYSVDPDVDYATGEDTTYAMHLGGCSAATELRIARLLQ